ncbi:MAG: PQQ-binding-like beta-propeller repeat protein [Acidobacteriota bacterium]|nr:PQQ-binding-like beta-propeller repeat protein [Acidobacteriota bacterium]
MEIAWNKELGSGYSSIIVADGRVLTGFSDGKEDFVVALDAGTGAELWRYRIGPTFKSPADDGTIATPLFNDGMVYGLGGHGDLFGLDAGSGKQVWRLHLVDDFGATPLRFGFGTSSLVAGDVLVIQTGVPESAGVTGLHKKTGKKLWAVGKGKVSYQSPVLVELLGKQQVICAMDKKLMGIDPQTGQMLWEYDTGGSCHSGHPVMAGDDKVFIRYKFEESTMLQFAKSGDTYTITPKWTSRELTKTEDIGVYYDGYLYGFSGRFLTCVDANTGKRTWKSRPPGDGFVMMTDGHLVVITKKGSLHLIEASPEAYREKAGIEVFDSLGWSSPTLAGGHAYVRNLKRIARVNLGATGTTNIAAKKKKGVLPQTRFAAWVRELEANDDKKAAIDTFLAKQKSFPIMEGDRFVHVVYRGDVPDAAISGEGPGLGTQSPLNQVAGSDFYYFSFELPRDAHISYQIAVNFEEPGPDPRNPYKVQDRWSADEYHSLLAMPGWSDSNHLVEPKNKGKLVTVPFKSEHTKMERKLRVHLPAGYEQGERRYPVLYVTCGPGAVEKGLLTHTLDNLAGKKTDRIIAVFVDSKGWAEGESPMVEDFAAMLTEELVPFIDQRYRTNTGKRAILAHARQAYPSIRAALAHPGTFCAVATQSGEFNEAMREALAALVTEASMNQRLIIEWGAYDGPADDPRQDVPAWNEAMVARFGELGLKVENRVLPMGDEWGNWRTRHDDLLQLLFPLEDM